MRNAAQHGPAISDDFLDSIRSLSSRDFDTNKEEIIALGGQLNESRPVKKRHIRNVACAPIPSGTMPMGVDTDSNH